MTGGKQMTSRERVLSVLEGRKPDIYPVMAPYVHYSNADHWTEVTGEPVWKFFEWTYTEPDEHTAVQERFYDLMPFDVALPWYSLPREERKNHHVVFRDGTPYIEDKRSGSLRPVPVSIHESKGAANETRYIKTAADIKSVISFKKAEDYIAEGSTDYISAFAKRFPDLFTISGGFTNTFYANVYHVGMTNFLMMIKEEPALIHEISKRVLECNIEWIRACMMAGGDAFQIDDALSTSDMVSVKTYEEFSLPYITELIKEIHKFGKKAVVLYFGGIADRVEQILSAKPDLIIMEASMKGFVNDYESIHRQINGRCCLAGNLNPYIDVERKSDEELRRAINEQAMAGKTNYRYITSTGSLLTPGTSVKRIADFIRMGHEA